MKGKKRRKVCSSIASVAYKKPATIVFWKDGDKTVAKCGPDDVWDEEKGLLVAMVKHYMKYAYYSRTSERFKKEMAEGLPKHEAVAPAESKCECAKEPSPEASQASVG